MVDVDTSMTVSQLPSVPFGMTNFICIHRNPAPTHGVMSAFAVLMLLMGNVRKRLLLFLYFNYKYYYYSLIAVLNTKIDTNLPISSTQSIPLKLLEQTSRAARIDLIDMNVVRIITFI
jgi:hypothetical protein